MSHSRQRSLQADVADSIGRREAIRRAALVLGGALSASSIAAVLAGCGTGRASTDDAWKPRALSSSQGEMIATIAEHILPQTDTPGARAAGVHRFIDSVLADFQQPAERKRFIAGLADVDARAKRAYRREFLACDPAQQRVVVEAMDREAFPRKNMASVNARSEPFMRSMKELTVLGYYTSEIGATKELRYERVPGRFDGCVPLAAADRTWAV